MIGDIISAGGRLIGGFLDRDTANKNRDQEMRIAQQNMQLQRDFAQQGIRWKVDDAKAAGIHPLYALGANTTSFSPVSISGGSSSNWSDTLGNMGQDISRAVNSTRTQGERTDAFTQTSQRLQLEGLQLDNDIKRASIASAVKRLSQSDQRNPPMPDIGPVPKADKFEDRPRLALGNGEISTDGEHANAEDFEKRYGDIAQELAGAANMWADYQKNYRDSMSPIDRRIREFVYDRFRVPGRKGDRWDMRYRARHYHPISRGGR